MKKRYKKEWLKALRSGEYEQGRGRLCRDGKYCCIGVLADTVLDEYWEDAPLYGWAIRGSTLALDIETLCRLGLSSLTQSKLAEFNDVHLLDFNQIADWIEANL